MKEKVQIVRKKEKKKEPITGLIPSRRKDFLVPVQNILSHTSASLCNKIQLMGWDSKTTWSISGATFTSLSVAWGLQWPRSPGICQFTAMFPSKQLKRQPSLPEVGATWTNAGLLSALDGDRCAFVLQCAILLPAQYTCILKLIHINWLLPCWKKLNSQFFKVGWLETQTLP